MTHDAHHGEAEAPRPRVKLLGRDGNAFAILGACLRAARAAGWSEAEIARFQAEATRGNYDQLLATVMEHFEVE